MSQTDRKQRRSEQKLVGKLVAKVEKVQTRIAEGKPVFPDPGEGAI